MYIVNKNENCHFFDVDDTLVFWSHVEGVEPITIKNGNYSEIVYPNYKEIESLKRAKLRGHFVTVHSQGGWQWAELVVNTLELQGYVDSIATKPKWYHDDLPADSWMTRFYSVPEGYKP